MKRYGFKKATEFTAKQVSVLYRAAKSGRVKIEKWFIGKIYDAAEYFGYDDDCSMERFESSVKQILDAIFAEYYEEAQKLIDIATESEFKSYTEKYQKKFDRNLVA